jgi:hypothetical protein
MEPDDYSPHEEGSFNRWVELGPKNPDDAPVTDFEPLTRWAVKFQSSSPQAEDFIHDPLKAMIDAGVPGVSAGSRIETHIMNHEKGLRHRIIRVTATVDTDGNVSNSIHKEEPGGH